MDVTHRLGLRRRARARPAGSRRSRASGIVGRHARQRTHLHQLRGPPLRRRSPHRPAARARGDPRGPARGGRARSTARSGTSPSAAPPGSRTATGRPARPRARSTSTPGVDSLGAGDRRRRSIRSRSRASAAPSPRSRPAAISAGRFRSEGTLSRLAVDADLTGDLGDVRAAGLRHRCCRPAGAPRGCCSGSRGSISPPSPAGLCPPRSPASSAPPAASTRCGRPRATLELALTRSRIREWTLDSVFGRGGVHDSVIRVDTAYAEWKGARASGGGTLGWRAPHDGRMRFDPRRRQPDRVRLAAARGHPADAGHQRRRAAARRPGARGGWSWPAASTRSRPTATFEVDGLRVAADRARRGSPAPHLARRPSGPASRPRVGRRLDPCPAVDASPGPGGAVGGLRRLARLERGHQPGRRRPVRRDRRAGTRKTTGALLWVDTLLAQLAVRQYRLEQPVTIALADSAPSAEPARPARARRLERGARPRARCRAARRAISRVQVLGLDLHDLYGLHPARHHSASPATSELDLQVGGHVRGADLPRPRAAGRRPVRRFPVAVRAGRAQLRATAGSTPISISGAPGERLLQVEAHLPLDLALTGVEQRQTEGPLFGAGPHGQRLARTARGHYARGHAGRRDARGRRPGRRHLGRPRLTGSVDVRRGSMSLPGLGVRFGERDGRRDCSRATRCVLRDVLLTSGGGKLRRRRLDPAREPLAPAADARLPGRAVPRHRRAQLPDPGRHRRPPAPRSGVRLDPHRAACSRTAACCTSPTW